MPEDLLYTIAHPEFYEDLSRYHALPEFASRVREILPPDCVLERRSYWLHARMPGRPVPAQGFKIHVSAVQECAMDLLALVAHECAQRRLNFKFIADRRLLTLQGSKSFSRSSSGKFMTLYPHNEQEFRELIDHLYQQTSDSSFMGPFVLSDRRYKHSRVLFYRYGGLRPLMHLNVDGTKRSLLVAPDGSTMPDERRPYFKLPRWVDDPFGGTRELEGQAEPVLSDRFRVKHMIAASNRGGVYEALDEMTGKAVILKEARPQVQRLSVNGTAIDAITLLRREFHTLQTLAHLGHTPEPVLLFEQWEHTFLAVKKIDGTILSRFVVRPGNHLLPHIRRPGTVARHIPKLATIAAQLVSMMEQIHNEGIILGDVSPANIVISRDDMRVSVIDVESAVAVDDQPELRTFAKRWFTPGYGRPGRRAAESIGFEDDYYALGMVLYSLLIGGMRFFELNPDARWTILEDLARLGVPVPLCEAIVALLTGDLQRAKLAVDTLETSIRTEVRGAW